MSENYYFIYGPPDGVRCYKYDDTEDLSSETADQWAKRVWKNCRLKFHEKTVNDIKEKL